MNYLVQIFAGIFARFKQKNPVVAGIIALVLLAVVYTADQGTALGVFTLPVWAKDISEYLMAFHKAEKPKSGKHTNNSL